MVICIKNLNSTRHPHTM